MHNVNVYETKTTGQFLEYFQFAMHDMFVWPLFVISVLLIRYKDLLSKQKLTTAKTHFVIEFDVHSM